MSLLAAGAIQSHRAPAWAESLAASKDNAGPAPAPALFERIEQGLYKRNAPVVITEAELNRYLNAHLRAMSTGPLAENISIDRFYVQCQREGFEVRLLWRATNNHPATASMRFQVTRKENQFLIEPVGGSYGRMNVPRGIMAPILPALQSLATSLKSELDLAFQMNQLKFEPGKIVLDPRLETVAR
ncbi:hypothetical protein FEM03_16575 [Phragmitibacter flavus]|uniref:Uncharacterized protein n=1 Tax=Phragmitibacter flavus TaxID=2576071 RepID=A0A5R8KB82_9BACT|nr:hypothetical protein FEM03_16575 [Phragmitibacter flavus]